MTGPAKGRWFPFAVFVFIALGILVSGYFIAEEIARKTFGYVPLAVFCLAFIFATWTLVLQLIV